MPDQKSIGGEMEIRPTDLLGPSMRDVDSAWPTFKGYHEQRCSTGRSAFLAAVLLWRKKAGPLSKVWIPAYICHSIIQVLTEQKISYSTYIDIPGEKTFIKPPSPLENDLVVIVHFFGLINKAALQWLNGLFITKNWYLLEDAVQSPYSLRVHLESDYIITSLRKWWSSPDGASLYSKEQCSEVLFARAQEEFVSQRFLAKLIRNTKADVDGLLALGLIEDSEQLLDSKTPYCSSWISNYLLARVDLKKLKRRRRANWQFLDKNFRNNFMDEKALLPLLGSLSQDEVPLVYPILILNDQRDFVREQLKLKKIYCPVHWTLDESVDSYSRDLSSKILSLPIDQRYSPKDMMKILEGLKDLL